MLRGITVTSKLLVLILGYLACKTQDVRGGTSSDGVRLNAYNVLAALISRANMTFVRLRLVPPAASIDESGLVSADDARHCLSLTVNDGRVDATPLREYHLPQRFKKINVAMAAALDGMPTCHVRNVKLVDLLVTLLGADLPTHKDLFLEIGLALDAQLRKEKTVLDSGLPDSAGPEHLRPLTDEHLHAREISHTNVRILQAAQVEIGKFLNYSMATDAARTGLKSRQNTLLVLPSNSAFWAPPTVFVGSCMHIPPSL